MARYQFTSGKTAQKAGRKGGLATKRRRGKAFFSKISRMRTNFRGGRHASRNKDSAGEAPAQQN